MTGLRGLLLAVVKADFDLDEIEGLAGAVDPDDVVEAAIRHGVVSLIHERLQHSSTLAPVALHTLRNLRIARQMVCLQLQHAVGLVAANLDVPWLAVKGDVLASWYQRPDSREFSDVDVLVRPSDFGRAFNALEAAGHTLLGSNWHGFREYQVAEVPLRLPAGSIDLHWHLVAMGESRRHVRLPTEELFERAVSVQSGGTGVLTLDPVDTLTHLCVGVGLDGGRRLRGFVDLDVVIRSGLVDLSEFAERARVARVGRLSAAVLQRTHSLLGTPLPDGLLDDLGAGRAWLAANRQIDRISSRRTQPSSGIASGLLLSSGRDSARATAVALSRSVRRAVTSAAGRPGLTDPGGALDWQRVPEDGDVDKHRREYLDWVASVARGE